MFATTGILGIKGPFWPLPSAYLTGASAAAGIAFINSLGNLGGFFGPSIVMARELTSKIFMALLAKRFAIRPEGWEQVAAPFSDDQRRSIADVDSPATLLEVRAFKKAKKAEGKGKDGLAERPMHRR